MVCIEMDVIMKEKDILKKFCYDHNIKILDTNKRAYTYTKLNTSYFQYPNDLNIVDSHTVQDTEPLYTIEIAFSELEKIAEFESQVFNHMRAKGHYDMFNMIMEQKEREKKLRNNYPAVQKAYEQYSMMLKLAEGGDL
jgi:hypothetical protein